MNIKLVKLREQDHFQALDLLTHSLKTSIVHLELYQVVDIANLV